MRRRFALVFNAKAGVAFPRLLDGVLRRLRGGSAEIFQLGARTAEEACARVADVAAKEQADAVIAAGGDGTFRAVAIGAADTSLPVGVIPLGTGNIIAREIGLTRRADIVADVLTAGPVIDARGGSINGERFFLMVGAGFDARIVNRLDYRSKRLLGRAAYAYPVLKTLAEGPQTFDIEVDGQHFEASWAIASLASRYGGAFVITRTTKVGQENLTVTLFEARTRGQLLAGAAALGLGRVADPARRPSNVRSLSAKRVRIGRRVQTPIEVDGDSFGNSPAEIVADGSSIRLIVPPQYVADLTNCRTNHLGSDS